MSEIKNKDRILEAIDQLRRRKARPDIERICNFLLRRFAVDSRDTIADLSRLVDAEIVIKVEYKGNTSYRNAAKWSRLAVHHKNKESVGENNNVPDARSLLSRAFASLLVEDPDYLDFGVPGNELKKFLLEDDPCTELPDLDAILQRELNSGYLVKLENCNYSLADHPVPPSPIKSNANNTGDIQMLKLESSSSSLYQAEADNLLSRRHDGKNTTKATDVNSRRNIKIEGIQNTFEDTATGAINIGGFRVGVRRKRAKKVFDPSDNNIPTRKRGRPLGSTKTKETGQSNNKVESTGAVCLICHRQGNNRRGQFEKLISCKDCSTKVHPSCVEINNKGLQTINWQCAHCRICAHCYESAGTEVMVVCNSCGEGYHISCHTPRVPDKIPNGKWFCYRCVPTKPKSTVAPTVSSAGLLPTPHESPVPDAMSASYPAPASTASGDSDEQIDECIPDASDWSVEQVSKYLSDQGYPDQAAVFKANEIDGASLLLMKRSDVLTGLHMKLGPALKIYGQVKRLQIRQSDPRLLWA